MNKVRVREMAFDADDANVSRRAEESQRICRILQERIPLAGTILCFMPLKDEVDIRPLFEAIRACGGTVVLPYCTDKSHMLLKVWRQGEPLVLDAMRVSAPRGGDVVDAQQIDAALIPAVALGAQGERLGRGRGFYDRLLPLLRKDALKIGVCHSWRLREDFPTLAHDARVDLVAASLLDDADSC